MNSECAVSTPTGKALVKGQMLDYCGACLRDIEQAREHWLTGKIFPEDTRLPQPDPATSVARLKPYNFREGGEADQLLGYGKAVVPALLGRLDELPGTLPSSPREQAALLVLKIVAIEDGRRKGEEPREVASLNEAGCRSGELKRWWAQEGERFMKGDGWTLPCMLDFDNHESMPHH